VNLWLALVVVLGSALLSAVCVAVSIRLADRFGIHDHPDGARKSQQRPIPRLGGLAVAIAFTVAAPAALFLHGRSDVMLTALGILIPALVAAVLGYCDDLWNIEPRLRLLLQGGIGLLAWVLGTRIDLTHNALIDLPLTVLWFMVIVNGINLLDNSDGLAGSTVLVSAAGATCVAAIFDQALVVLLALALVGVCAGFLWHNWYPAKVYLGDSGAYFLGALLASLVIRLRPETVSPAAGALIALLLLALPLVDTTYVVVKRIRHGIHPFTAGRDHLSHTLQDAGASVPVSVLALQSLLLVTVCSAVAVTAVLT
jgi:UDP-GlcNAc:undecaprenyl-phosphate GlcNAc-1-phosphate transferase